MLNTTIDLELGEELFLSVEINQHDCVSGRGILNALTRYSNVSTFQYVDFILKWEGI